MSLDTRSTPLWLELRPAYAGHGRAELVDPELVIEGSAEYRFDDATGGESTMQIETADPEGDFLERWQGGFLGAFQPKRLDRYRRFTISGSDGDYVATGRVYEAQSEFGSGSPVACIRALRAEYQATPPVAPKFWILPLYNMHSVTFQALGAPHGEGLDHHPLRFFRCPAPPLSPEQDDLHQILANQHNRLVPFSYRDRLGFIEPLPDYSARLERLQSGRDRRVVTAVMVCEADGDAFDAEDPDRWFPIDILNVLSLATGCRVGAPWLEYRDEQARLSRRIHIRFGTPEYRAGHPALDELMGASLGGFLSHCLAADALPRPFLRVTMTHLLNAGIRHGSVEETFLCLCRAFETLARHYGLARQDLTAPLDPTAKAAVIAALNEAASRIGDLAASHSDPAQRDSLHRIAQRARSANHKDMNFGESVAALVAHFGFRDASILRRSYQSSAGETWVQQLSALRGAVVHEGALNTTGQHDLREVVRVSDHLHDLLLRIVLRILGVSTRYSSPIPPMLIRDIDWVTDAVLPGALIAPY